MVPLGCTSSVIALTATAVTAEVYPVADAVIVVLPTPTPVTLTLAVVAPAATLTDAGTVAIAALALCRLIVTPPAGAGEGRVTANPTVSPGATSRFAGAPSVSACAVITAVPLA